MKVLYILSNLGSQNIVEKLIFVEKDYNDNRSKINDWFILVKSLKYNTGNPYNYNYNHRSLFKNPLKEVTIIDNYDEMNEYKRRGFNGKYFEFEGTWEEIMLEISNLQNLIEII